MKTTFLILAAFYCGAASLRAASLPESSKIDSILKQEWEKNKITPNAPANDSVLVRRLYLDIAGRIPTVEESQEFVNSTASDKKVQLIDKLLNSDGYTSNMFNYWADILRLTDNTKGRTAAEAYAEYVKRCLKENKPYDQFVRDLLTSEGGVWDTGAIGFYMRDDNKLDHLAYTVQVFLGTSIVCAQCHNHPFDKWSQKDYYGMAAYTYGMDTKGTALEDTKGRAAKNEKAGGAAVKRMTKEERRKYMAEHQAEIDKAAEEQKRKGITSNDIAMVRNSLKDIAKPLRYTVAKWSDNKLPTLPSDYKYPDGKPGQAIQPKTMFGHEAVAVEGQNRLNAFAQWMAAPDNPRFTTVIANRMWKKAFGLGLIEPVDEMTDSTTPSNGELMEYLSQLMVEQKYSLKNFLRVLYNTETYQRTATTKEVPLGETYHFAGPILRRMSAEQVWDSMVTLSKGVIDGETSEENEQLHTYLSDMKLLVDTMKGKGIEGLAEIAKRSNDGTDKTAVLAKMESLRKESLEAQKAGDKEKGRLLAQQAEKLRRQGANDLVVAMIGEEKAEDIRKNYGGKKGKGKGAEVDKQALMALSKDERKLAIQMGTTLNLNHRASEISSPAKPGHFLRTFGQSDRELISNASDEASVPQALALLNGPASEVLNNPLSKLHQALNKAATTDEKLEALYLAFFSRKPTEQEKSVIAQVVAERGEKAVADVTHALLTGSQFLYIQ